MENNNVTFHQKNVLLDIEGTTTSITFVKDVLFPYVREHLKEYFEQNKADEELQSVIDLLKKQNEEDKNNKLEGMVPILEGDPETDSIIRNVMWQMDNDRKTYSLKKLQGCIWRNGYSTGHLKSHLYEDVPSSLKCWKENGKNLFIYSSGSVEAQKLLFENTIYGNLLELFSGHFDTSVGSKTSSESYVNIAKAINCNCSDLLFITDTVKEAEAASEAGCGVIISVRPNNIPLSLEEMQKYVCIQSFEQLCPKL